MKSSFAVAASGLALLSSAQVITNPQTLGPSLELIHLYNDQWPTGIAVSSTGRLFSNYPGGLDANNTNSGSNGKYAVAELIGNNTQKPYPSVEINNPPGGSINYTTNPPSGANYPNYLISVQSVVVDPADRVWILDTGRALTNDSVLVPATPGGPKLVGVSLTNNTVFKTILFPSTVAFADSYLNDVRFDLRKNLTASGQGVAYITDSSNEGRNGIIIVDLGTGESWRHLTGAMQTRPDPQFVPFVWGTPLYAYNGAGQPYSFISTGSDGIALSADGSDLYFGAVASDRLYSVPTAALRARDSFSEIKAQQAVVQRGSKGVSDGFETDTNGFIYHGRSEQEAIAFYNPINGTDNMFVRDPRINWVDTMATGTDGYLYFTVNQLDRNPGFNLGVDRRVRPFALFRAKLPNGGKKVLLQ